MRGRGVRFKGSREVNLGVELIFVDPKEKGGVNFGVRHEVTWEGCFFVGGVVERAERERDGGGAFGAGFEVEFIKGLNDNVEGENANIEFHFSSTIEFEEKRGKKGV